jgi:hypothetical protein
MIRIGQLVVAELGVVRATLAGGKLALLSLQRDSRLALATGKILRI